MVEVSEDRVVLARVVDRLRSLPESRLTRADESGSTVAGAVHELAVWAAGSCGSPDPVPALHPLASGDQLAVVGREFLDRAADGTAPLSQWRDRVSRLRARL